MKFAAGFLLLLSFSALSGADELKPFTTDGCSSFPDGTIEHQSLWVECCIRHDLAYWQGGSRQDRLNADKQLESCVAGVGEPEIASVMLAGVRVGGSPYLPTPFRWGYGWPYPRAYKALDLDEKNQVKRRLEQFGVLIRSVESELN